MSTTTQAVTAREPEIRCEGLVRVFASHGVEVQALQGLDLTIGAGELVAVVGASGSGKSTLLTILSGLDLPTAGRARVAGHDLTTMGARERLTFRRRSVGFVWQQTGRNLLPFLSAQENVEAVTAIARTTRRRERAARAVELLDLLGVADVRDERPARLSGGQQQRVAIAVALANEPRVLLADEPTGELDEAASVGVLEAMRTVNEARGVTTLVVTHDASVSSHVRRTVQIRDGRTSTEVLRSTHVDEHGREHTIAQEYAVLDRAGRLQLPAAFTEALDLRERVRLGLEPDHVTVRPDGRAPDRPASDDPPGDGARPDDEEPR
ncbi:ABC transporter ATP-binding protein [Cellulomonas massiliensis]|uniref:ABC transporter ATP-binding protein n=1 Tax=Cellulomonas massiliensis TaxID=1465811 RepID=UPI000366018A|nr:ABC transporter ATP-binding protein [Cellulomonas massiliensis]